LFETLNQRLYPPYLQIVDFDLSQDEDSPQIRGSTMPYTPPEWRYALAEFSNGHAFDLPSELLQTAQRQSADIFMIGVTWLELLCGRGAQVSLYHHLVSPECRALILSCIDDRPSQRPTVTQLLQDTYFKLAETKEKGKESNRKASAKTMNFVRSIVDVKLSHVAPPSPVGATATAKVTTGPIFSRLNCGSALIAPYSWLDAFPENDFAAVVAVIDTCRHDVQKLEGVDPRRCQALRYAQFGHSCVAIASVLRTTGATLVFGTGLCRDTIRRCHRSEHERHR
jgi:hypothetical protein